MAPPKQLDIAQQLAALQADFKLTLPEKIAEIENLWQLILADEAGDTAIADCHRMVHSLVGAGGTFGAIVVSTASREVEQSLKLIADGKELSTELKSTITRLVQDLKAVADSWQPSSVPYVEPIISENKNDSGNSNLIYLAEDDELFAADLIVKLEHDGFVVKHFIELDDFVKEFSIRVPSAIIMDVVFKEGGIAGADTITQLKKENGRSFPPVIFISVRDDIEARLAAVRAGTQRYFSKPFDTEQLSKTLSGLIERTVIKPYRVLCVDDDTNLLKYYETVLTGAGMEVKTVSNPLDTLDVLKEFKPDVTVLDVYMPQCNGTEIAQVIRQNDKWSLIPILFLSTEADLDKQLEILDLGGESFMLKPIESNHLIATITTKANISRRNHRINNDLKMALREHEFQVITSNQHNIVSTADITGRITSVNNNFCDISGYSREELIGQNHRLLKSNFHPDSFYQDMWKTISSGQVWHGVIANVNKSGETYWVESTIVPFIDDKGKPYKYVSARTDITTVVESEERLERSQDFANIGTWDWSIETGSLFWSDKIWPLFGYDKKVTETTYDNFMAAIHPDDRQMVGDAVMGCVEKGEDYNIEHRVIWPDGSTRWLHESGDVVLNKDGKPTHMLGVVQDITKRKNAEQAMIEAREDAETANRAKSEFLSSMSHELRTPMNAIMGFGQLLNMEGEQSFTDSQKENVTEILKASDHLLELINEVLDLSKIEAGRIDLSIEDVLLGGIISESLQLILPLADKQGISVKLLRGDIEISLDELINDTNIVRADHTRTKQVIINLLSNAVKYNSENGKITIQCIKSDNNVRVSITDTGAGLNQEQQSQLFKAFDRLGAENTEIEGTGIGLVITQNIVQLMGGHIGVESEPGVGSTFWFELPNGLTEIESKHEDVPQSEYKENISEERTVLYIEDNPANLRLVTQLLGRLPNIHMWSVHEPMLGFELAVQHNPDLILLDINLPGMNGYEVLKLLRQQKQLHDTPVIAISANAMPKDIERGLDAGFNDYITKPIDISKLLSTVESTLNS